MVGECKVLQISVQKFSGNDLTRMCLSVSVPHGMWKPPVNGGSLFAVTQVDRTMVYSLEQEATARGGYRLSGYS
jgi:hypothetical protein